MKILLILAAVVSVSYCLNQNLKCQKCESNQGDCNVGVCEGIWCTASVTENKATRTRSLKKDCATANPANAKEDACQKDTLPDGSETYRCGCNSGDNCNSESGIARMQAMLTNQFSLAGAAGVQPLPGAPSQPNPSGQPPQVPTGLINPNSTFTDVLSGQPSPTFPGSNPSQPGLPLPGQPQPGQPQPGQVPNVLLPNAGNQQPVPQFPPPNGSQPPFPQGGANVPPGSPNLNKPNGPRPGQPDLEGGFPNGPVSGIAPNSNGIDQPINDTNKNPSDVRPGQPPNDLSGNSLSGQEARSKAGAVNVKDGPRTCACTEPSCNGPCRGEVCYQMMFSAGDVRNQAFAGKQGQITQAGCTDDSTVISGGGHHAHRQLPDYKFKINGQEINVPASAMYCNDMDFCNSAIANAASFLVIIACVMGLFMRF